MLLIWVFSGPKTIEDAKIDKESIDYIIVAHNFGDVKSNTIKATFFLVYHLELNIF